MTLSHGAEDIVAKRTAVQKSACKSEPGFLCRGWKKRPKELTPRCGYYKEGKGGGGKGGGGGGQQTDWGKRINNPSRSTV